MQKNCGSSFEKFNRASAHYTPLHIETKPFNEELMRQGYLGQNKLLVYAIAKNDVSFFIKAVMEGAEYGLVFRDRSLLDIAAENGRSEILLFLLSLIPPSVNLMARLKIIALKSNQAGVVALIEELTKNNDSSRKSPLLEQQLHRIKSILEEYQKEQETHSEAQKLQNKMNAVHGSTGHNEFLEAAIKEGNFKHFSLALQAGAFLKSYEIPFERIFQSKKGILENLKDSLDDEGVKKGIGKSLLHLAATHNRVDMIYHLLERGLDPNEPDEQGLTPLMVALKEGHLEAAFLMMKIDPETGKFSKDQFALDTETLNAVISWMVKGSELRDPLRVNNNEKMMAAMAAAFFLSRTTAPGSLGSFLSILPVIMFSYKTVYGNSLKEENPREEVTHSHTFKVLNMFVAKGELIELLSPISTLPVFRTISTALGAYSSGKNALTFLAHSYKKFLSRPKQAAFKAGVKMLNAAYNITLIKQMITGWMFIIERAQMPNKELTVSEALDTLNLQSQDFILASNMAEVHKMVKQAHRNISLSTHPDKSGELSVDFDKLKKAKNLLLKLQKIDEFTKPQTPSRIWEVASKIKGVALKVGVIFGMDKASRKLGKNLWSVAQLTPWIIMGKNIFSHSDVSSDPSFKNSDHPSSNENEANGTDEARPSTDETIHL